MRTQNAKFAFFCIFEIQASNCFKITSKLQKLFQGCVNAPDGSTFLTIPTILSISSSSPVITISL
ncbi:hypothetical protein [Campylobacter hyointestinalis]|uniref:hypothetical protein n=1 Tax=Campylobacter hyointestinalis TaxID=198 RepID=UPI00072882A2|nr:hypothetical protein [Campylobacter hyointestinalis]CUU82033.1 Uncharacterised protein [Campylobacter hyointestinalis subsp. hyointestinalis]